jgi:hypothetical protein
MEGILNPRRNLWTNEEQTMLAWLADEGLSTLEIGLRLGRTRAAVMTQARDRGIKIRRLLNPPEGLMERAALMSTWALCKETGRNRKVVMRWIAAMPDDWQAERSALIRSETNELRQAGYLRWKLLTEEQRREMVEAPGGEKILRRRADRRASSARYWAKKKAKNHAAREAARVPPADFWQIAQSLAMGKIERHYHIGSKLAAMWVATLSPAQQDERKATLRANSRKAGLRVRPPKVERPKPKPVAKKSFPVNWGFHTPIQNAGPPVTLASRAADFLRRPPCRFSNVYNAEIQGKALKGYYVVARMGAIKTEAMIELAKQRGFVE